MQELENLLNSLIQRGWKPWGKYDKILNLSKYNGWLIRLVQSNNAWMYVHIRSIVSLESGLWQFCVENELTRWYNWDEWKYTEIFPWDYRDYPADEHKYRLLESALIPEQELGKFLIENIVIEWNSK